jgi:hypothetical protein
MSGLVPDRYARRLITAVSDEFRADMRRLLGGGNLGGHRQALLAFVSRRERLDFLLRYGTDRLPPDRRRPDDALATFFLVVSELRACPQPVRIFATKCMEYCESEALDRWSDSLPQLQRAYAALTRRGLRQAPNAPAATATTPTFRDYSRRRV